MPDYEEMYYTLLTAVLNTVDILNKAVGKKKTSVKTSTSLQRTKNGDALSKPHFLLYQYKFFICPFHEAQHDGFFRLLFLAIRQQIQLFSDIYKVQYWF